MPRPARAPPVLALTNAVRKTDNFWLAIRNGLASYWNMIVLFKDGIVV